MKRSMVYALLAIVSGGLGVAPAATAATWVMWDGATPQYVTYVETPPPVYKDVTKPIIVDQSVTKAVIIERDLAFPRWQMHDPSLSYEPMGVINVTK